MDRYTRHQLKQDEFQEKVEVLQVFAEEHLKQIILIGVAVIVVVAGVFWIRNYYANQEAAANAELQTAVTTFSAYVGNAQQSGVASTVQTFPTAKAKYQKALSQFAEVVKSYPRTKAGGYALVQMGVCQSQLGNETAAIKTLKDASKNSNKGIASQAQFALAGVLAKTGKTEEAVKIYQELANHPTSIVPRATSLLAMADAYRGTQPKRAREIYKQVQKEFGSDAVIADVLKQQLATLPQ